MNEHDPAADGVLRRELRAIQREAGHEGCLPLGEPFYDVQEQTVFCACGAPIGRPLPEAQSELAKLTSHPDEQVLDELAEQIGVDEFEQAQQHENEMVQLGQGIIDRHAPGVIESDLVAIDPTVPYGPAEVEAHMLDAAARLERGLRFEAALLVARLETEKNYKLAFALSLSSQSGRDTKEREAGALVDNQDLYRRMVLVQQVHEAMKSMTHTLRSVLSGYQSVSKSVTAAYGTVNAQTRASERR